MFRRMGDVHHTPAAARPLEQHLLFRTGNLDCAREQVARKFCRHRLETIGHEAAFDARHHHVEGEIISLNYLSYGADVLIEPGELTDFYQIQIPIGGNATIFNGGREVRTGTSTASILNADRYSKMMWWRGCEQLLINVNRKAFQDFAETLLGRHLPGPIVFDPEINLSARELMVWRRLVSSMFRSADEGTHFQATPNLSQLLVEQSMLERFLRLQPSNVSHFLAEPPAMAAPRHVKRADEFIRAHAGERLTIGDIARASGVAVRTLQLAYRTHRGCSPMKTLARERLKLARYDLLEHGGSQTVADTAVKWGFTHLGRFSVEYRREFGEAPSVTAKRNWC